MVSLLMHLFILLFQQANFYCKVDFLGDICHKWMMVMATSPFNSML